MEGSIGHQIGRYQVIREVGRGGMGAVYLAYDPSLQRNVAIKVLAPHLRWDTVFIERFVREARTAARLLHPGIVHIYEVGQEGGHNYFVMEYLEGESLKALVQRAGRLPPAQVLNILRQIASAVDYAHAQGVIHRDIKPANIIVTPEGRAVLTDFGIGRAVGDARLTTTGTALGTPDYMAPEQASGGETGPPADLYALAVVGYELLAGRVPFQADSDVAVLFQVVHDPPPPLHQWRPDLPAAVDVVLDRALAKSPRSRYPSGQAFIQKLEQALGVGEQPTVVAPVGLSPGRPRAARRLPLGLGIGLGLAGLFLLVLLVIVLSRGADQPASSAPRRTTPPGWTLPPSAALTHPPTTRPGAAPATARPTAAPDALPGATVRPNPSATPDPRVEIELAVREYTLIRADAEETLNADLLRQVCVDPYLSWKAARIQENIRDGTHWETWFVDWQITSVTLSGEDRADVWVRKTESKVFFARGSTIPDDEVCKGTIYSYRNCTYDAYYALVRLNGRWYVSDAQSPNANCQSRCQH